MVLTNFSPHHVDLIYSAALASFWRRDALRKFLRGCGIAERFLATWSEDESKRALLDRLFKKLNEATGGDKVVARMSAALCEQTTFPDLKGWEDTAAKTRAAAHAVEALKQFERKRAEASVEESQKKEAQARYAQRQQEVERARQDLQRTPVMLSPC